MKPLRIGPFKIINKISDITYENGNQDGYTSHIHRNHLVPYYPKEPIIFPFSQHYNPHSINNNYNDSDPNDPQQYFDFLSDEEQSIDDDQFTHSNSNKETDIPSTIDFQSEPFSQYSSSFPYQQNTPKTNNTKSENQTDIPITIILLIPEDTPVIDIISAQNHKKTIDFSSVKRI